MSSLLPPEFPFDSPTLVRRTMNITTNPEWGKKPHERTIKELIEFGVIILDKPPNMTSHEVTAWVAKILNASSAAHGGTLDPKVTGVLPIALGRATPIAGLWLKSNKEYIGVMKLHEDIETEEILRVFKEFTGRIFQRPPLRSAVKRRTRIRTIYELELLERESRNILFRVHCQAGTYIRKLCVDIGDALGVGAHMIDLRRTRSGLFKEEYAIIMQQLVDAYFEWKKYDNEEPLRRIIHPAEVGILHLRRIIISDKAIGAITYGAQLYAPGVLAFDYDIVAGETVALLSVKGELVGLAKTDVSGSDLAKMSRGQVTKKIRVLMPRDIYPPYWKGTFKRTKNA